MRNFSNIKGCELLHTYTNPTTKLQSAIMEVSAEAYKQIRENKNRIYVGFQSCKVFDHINVKPCFKCGRFGHNGAKCRNQEICLRCANNHNTRICNLADKYKWPNCTFSNLKYKTNYNTEHIATDTHECEILKAKLRKMIDNTDYVMLPIIPRYLGKVENPNHQTTSSVSGLTSNRLHNINSRIVDRRQVGKS